MTDEPALTAEAFFEAVQRLGRPVVTGADLAAVLDRDRAAIEADLESLAEAGLVGRRDATADPVVWYPVAWEDRLDRERVICFPDRRELVVDQPAQYTRAQLSQFAQLVATTGSGGYLYRIRPVDVWHAPYEDLAGLERTMREVLPGPQPALFEWIADQWQRANQFRLETHPDGYTVLTAGSASLLSNVAEQELDEDQLRARISETEAWVASGSEAEIKRRLYEAGFPVKDERELEEGDPIEVSLRVDLRDYQRTWIDSFMERGSGVLVGPPGSGKTVAALGILERVGGETLVLVPSRELAGQWHERILADTDLPPEQVGEYHGGVKQRRPVTVATYHVAAMSRHRSLFDERRWGLVVFDECLAGETVVETAEGRTTFSELDDRFSWRAGWNDPGYLSVRTYDPGAGRSRLDRVDGIYKTTAPVHRIATESGAVVRATAGHTHLVWDPVAGRVREQRGVSPGEYLVRPNAEAETVADGGHSNSIARSPSIPRAAAGTQAIDRSASHDTLEFVRVESVTTDGTETVYDFETASHTFLANGFLTHNCHHIPAEVFSRAADLQGRHRLGLSASPVRGDEKEDEIFTLIGPPIGTDWAALIDAGHVIEPELEIRYLPWGTQEASDAYAAAQGHERRQEAAMNPAKVEDVLRLRDRHANERVIVFVDWLDQGSALAEALDAPFISGETPHARRERFFADFRDGPLDTLVVSRVGDEGLDLPDASVAILASGLGGSRRQGTQRVGRTMRPVGGSKVYVLATRGTEEEDFAQQQLRHLQTKGMRVSETTVELEVPDG